MNAQVHDFPEQVEQTESTRQRLLQPLAFDEQNDSLEWTVRDVIEELEFLVDMRATMASEDFQSGVRDQARRLLK